MKKKIFLLLLFLNGFVLFYSPIFGMEEAGSEDPSQEPSSVDSRNDAGWDDSPSKAASQSDKRFIAGDNSSASQGGTSDQGYPDKGKKKSDPVSHFSNHHKSMDIQRSSSAVDFAASTEPYSKTKGSTGLLGGSRISEVDSSVWRDSHEEYHDFEGASFTDHCHEVSSSAQLREEAVRHLQEAKEISLDYKSLVETWGEKQDPEGRRQMLQLIVETQLLPPSLFGGDEASVSQKIKTICSNWTRITPKDRQDVIARELLNFPESWRDGISEEERSSIKEELQDLENRFTIVVLLKECERLTTEADGIDVLVHGPFTETRVSDDTIRTIHDHAHEEEASGDIPIKGTMLHELTRGNEYLSPKEEIIKRQVRFSDANVADRADPVKKEKKKYIEKPLRFHNKRLEVLNVQLEDLVQLSEKHCSIDKLIDAYNEQNINPEAFRTMHTSLAKNLREPYTDGENHEEEYDKDIQELLAKIQRLMLRTSSSQIANNEKKVDSSDAAHDAVQGLTAPPKKYETIPPWSRGLPGSFRGR